MGTFTVRPDLMNTTADSLALALKDVQAGNLAAAAARWQKPANQAAE